MAVTDLDLGKYKLGWTDAEDYVFKPKKGLNEDIVQRDLVDEGRAATGCSSSGCKSSEHFERNPMPDWGGDMPDIDFDDIYYYIKPTERAGRRLGRAPRADEGRPTRSSASPRPSASTSPASPRSTSPRSSTTATARTSRPQGVLFCDMDTALREYPELVKQYFGTVIPPSDNKFAALNSAVWSGGSFIYVPPGVNVEMPLQAYFRINAENMGQFERTLIIADEGSPGALHRGLLGAGVHHRLAALGGRRDRRQAVAPGSRYTTIQNWSPNVYNLVTKRARVEAEGHMEWIDGNIGSQAHDEVPGGRTWSARRPRARCCRSPTPAPASTRTPGPR